MWGVVGVGGGRGMRHRRGCAGGGIVGGRCNEGAGGMGRDGGEEGV